MLILAAYQGTSWKSKLIRIRTWSDTSHVSLYDPVGNWEYEAWSKGVTKTLGIGFNHQPGTRAALFRAEAMSAEARVKAVAFAEGELGKPYDWRGLFGFLSRRDGAQNPTKWFCSEFVAACFRHGGYRLLRGVPDWRTYPGMLTYSPVLAPYAEILTPWNTEEEVAHD